ncbi:unnamed protein product, partial [Brenthis ino]
MYEVSSWAEDVLFRLRHYGNWEHPRTSANNIFNNGPVLPIVDSLRISSAYSYRPPAAPHHRNSREIDISLQDFKISETNCSLKKRHMTCL